MNMAFDNQISRNQTKYSNTTILEEVEEKEQDVLKIKLENIRNLVNSYYFPLIVTIGLIGNTLIILILSNESRLISLHEKHFKNSKINKQEIQNLNRKNSKSANRTASFSSTNYFLFSLACSDLIYNSILFLLYLTRIGVYDILNMNYVCQLTIAITYICSFLSAAFTTLFTFQRFMAVVFPLKSSATRFSLQSKHIIRKVIFALVIFSILIYSFSLYVYDTEPKKDYENDEAKRMCGIKQNYTNLVYIIENTLDSALTLIIPSISIICMNTAICRALAKHDNDEFLNKNNNNNSNNTNNEQQNHHASSSRRITKTLLIVSFAFVLLNSPYRLSKLISYISMSVKKQYVYSNVEFVINEVLINLYFTSYSLNFFFYSFTGKKFRHALKSLFLCLFVKSSYSCPLFHKD